MTALDVAILVVWGGLALTGFWKGALRIVLGIGGAVAGLWVAAAAAPGVERWVSARVVAGWPAAVLAYLAPFLATVAVALLAAWGLERTLAALHLRWLDRLAGAVVVGLAGAVVLGAVLSLGAAASPGLRRACERSTLAPVLMELVGQAGAAAGGAAASSGR